MKPKLLVTFLLTFHLLMLSSCAGFLKTPNTPFTEKSSPEPPDYKDAESWAALPDKSDYADKTPLGTIREMQSNSLVDVFFIHPTTLYDPTKWNGDVRDASLNANTDKTAIRNQASVFNAAGRIYAPRYRQMTLGGYYDKHDLVSNQKAYNLAYSDVKSAFQYYLDHYNQGRPIILAGHSQGAGHEIHLLKDFFDGSVLSSKLVAAYIVGMPIPSDTFVSLKPCASPGETGCYATWCSFKWGSKPTEDVDLYRNSICTNPITWKLDTISSHPDQHLGMINDGFTNIISKVIKVKVAQNYLWVTPPKSGFSVFDDDYHIYDYDLFWMDVRENAVLRTKKYLEVVH